MPVDGDARPGRRVESAVEEHPTVSCIMPTADRPAFVARAIRYFLGQRYPRKELIVVDDGREPVRDIIPEDARIRYVRLACPRSIGRKRNLACEMSKGSVVAQWDDDDWFGPGRLDHQVRDIAAGRADVTALEVGYVLDLSGMRFWRRHDPRPDVIFREVAGGTLVFTRDVWLRRGGYPDAPLAEDMLFLNAAMRRGARFVPLANNGVFICVRHGGNTWEFDSERLSHLSNWSRTSCPAFLGSSDRCFYRSLGVAAAGSSTARRAQGIVSEVPA